MEAVSGALFLVVIALIWKGFAAGSALGLDIFQFSSLQIGVNFLLPSSGFIVSAVFVSVVLRSLQFPFYIWMSDAARVRPPAFAFVFAAAPVVIGTYIMVRLNFLLVLSPKVMLFFAVVGALGAVYGSLASAVQKDTVKIIAYFIIAQAGLVFSGVGLGAFSSSVFHAVIFAIYTALLVFGAGSAALAVGSAEVRAAGGLKKVLPVTFTATVIGMFSAAGIYPFGGFFSRSSVMWEAYQRGHGFIFLAVFVSGVVCAVALFRMTALLFFGRFDVHKTGGRQPEEMSVSMLVVMVVFAFAALVSGWTGVSAAFGGENHFERWLLPGLATQMVHVIGEGGRFSELVVSLVALFFTVHAGLVTWIIYTYKRGWAAALAGRFPRTTGLFENGFYLNSFYRNAVARPLVFFGGKVVSNGVEKLIVEGVLIGGIERVLGLASDILRRMIRHSNA